MIFFVVTILVLFCTVQLQAREEEKKQDQLSLEDLLNTKIDTAAKYEQLMQDAPASISVITAEEIDRFGYRSVEEVLWSIPGFYTSHDRNYTYVGSRGFGRPTDYNNRFLVLYNGHSLNESYYGAASYGPELVVDMKSIERIEVVRGPGSALYGTGAMFGVINIITKKGGQENIFDLHMQTGSYGNLQGGLSFGKKLQNGMNVFVSGFLRNVNGSDLYFEEFDDPATNNGIAKGIDWDHSFALQTEISFKDFTFQGTYFGRDTGIPTAPWEVDFNEKSCKTYDNQGFLELKYQRDLSPDKNLIVRAYYNNYRYQGDWPYGGELSIDKNECQWAGGEAVFRWDTSPKNRLVIGTEYQNHFRAYYTYGDDYEIYTDTDSPFAIFSLFFQDEFQVTSQFSLIIGIRHDEYSTAGSSTSPRLAAVYHPFESATIKVLYGEAFRAPSAYELTYEDPIAGYKPNPLLDPETIRTLEFGWEQQIGRFFMGTASIFSYRMKGLIDWDIDPVDEFFQAVNFNDINAWGFELGFQAKSEKGLLAYTSYSFQNAIDTDTEAKLSNSPAHLLKAGISIPFLKQYYFSAQFIRESERITVYETKTKPFFLTNLTLSTQYLFDHVRAHFQIRNLFEQEYGYPGGWEHTQPIIYQDGRTVSLGIEYRY